MTDSITSILPSPHQQLALNNIRIARIIIKNINFVCQFCEHNNVSITFDPFGFYV